MTDTASSPAASLPTLLDELTRWIAELRHWQQRVPVIGISGAQGSGKSTLAKRLAAHLSVDGQCVAVLSLDDLYLGHAARQALARQVHPLLATRGVPGTHDVKLGIDLLDTLTHLADDERCALPGFDKLRDDRLPADDSHSVHGPVDVVLFEGWCLGITAQDAAALEAPVNALEAGEDTDGRWRHWVNDQLRDAYRPLFERIDGLVFLQVPDMDCVHRWRMQQEQENRQQSVALGQASAQAMDAAALTRFIQHYERLTRHALATLPAYADLCIRLDEEHRLAGWQWRTP